METNNEPKTQQEQEALKDENWEEVGSDVEQEENIQVVERVPKKEILKDKHGEIIINKLDAWVEPTKAVREARGDFKATNKYNFGDLSFDEEEEKEEEAHKENEDQEEEEEEGKRKKKSKAKKVNQEEDLDDLLAEFGIDAKVEKKPQSERKPKVKKEKKEELPTTAEPTEEQDDKKSEKKKKKPTEKTTTKKSSHVNELKREILERKEALKKKEKKKGL